MAKPPTADMTIDAMPTKELFIEMLTRDVALVPAIIDLADNCTDGARRQRPEGKWSSFEVEITIGRNELRIVDNCGGIPVKAAREYAFRFGRPSTAPPTTGEVGRFGVGMKRGLFKLGRHFFIKSTTSRSQFEVTIDVDVWARRKEWQFEFDKAPIENRVFNADQQGTTILVTRLHGSVEEHFCRTTFLEELRHELTAKLEQSIQRGMTVRVNGMVLKAHVRTLLGDRRLAPARKEFAVPGSGGGKVRVELWCGPGKPVRQTEARQEAGWYVFCNGRMLLEADKTAATGWGEGEQESIPVFHPQYNDFRGYAYLEADDAGDLPWNTTKTALDTEHPVYRRVRQEMIAIARPVITFFNKMKQERDARKEADIDTPGPLESLFAKAGTKPIEKIKPRGKFLVPDLPKLKGTRAGRPLRKISFERPQEQAEEVKDSLGVSTWREVGEQVFDYYYSAECAHG